MGGPRHCCIRGCDSRHKKGVQKQALQFYKLPSATSKESDQYEKLGNVRRKAWLDAINDSLETSANLENIRICSKHFASGKKANLRDQNNPDWVPHLLLGETKAPSPPKMSPTEKRGLPYCMACHTHFENSSILMRHMEDAHTTSTTTTLEILPLTIDQKLNELIERLKVFKWKSCAICIDFCQQFFEHIVSHSDDIIFGGDHAYTESTKPIVDEHTMEDTEQEERILDDPKRSVLAGPNIVSAEYQCLMCGNIFKSRATVDRCLKRHLSNQADYETNEDLNDSSILTITPIQSKTLGTTGLAVVESSLQLANLTTYMMPIKCSPCNVVCHTVDLFQMHIANVHGDNSMLLPSDRMKILRTIKCTICSDESMNFGTLEEALDHRYAQHHVASAEQSQYITTKRRFVVQSDSVEVEVAPNDVRLCRQNGIVEEFQCICGFRSQVKQTVDKCMAMHHGVRRYKCARAKRPNCDAPCGMEFLTAQELNDHDSRIHVAVAEHTEMAVCPTCATILPKRAMGLHRYTHKIAGPQKCETCGKTMASSRRLREHVRRVHKKVKKFMCPICFARFVYRASAELCAAKHSGAKSIHCECGKSFLTKAQRSAHRLVAHKISVES